MDDFVSTATSWLLANWEKVFVTVGVILGALEARRWVVRFERSYEKVADIQKSAFYSELDEMYANLLRIAIDKPYLRAPQLLRDDGDVLKADYDPYPVSANSAEAETVEAAHKRAQYDTYAFMIWNFLETIHDRCEQYPNLRDTWATIVAAEDQTHRGWFLQQMREARRCRVDCDKFCVPFQVFVYEKHYRLDKNGKYMKWSYDGRDNFTNKPDFKNL